MQKIADYIFNISPKKLAIYLILGPLLLFLVHFSATLTLRAISENDSPTGVISWYVIGILLFLLAVLILLWLFWIRSVVFSVEKSDLGISMRWFHISFILIVIYSLYNLGYFFLEYFPEDLRDNYTPFSEFVAFGGLLIAYPLLCHYAARAVSVKRNNKPATFIRAVPITLALFFGTVLAIPFLHNYFSKNPSANSKIILIYGLALGLFFALLIFGFIAAITGLV